MHMSTSFIATTMKITKPYTIYSIYKRLYIQENTDLFSVYNRVLFSLFLDNCIVWCSEKHMNHSIAVCVISFTLILLFRNQLLNEVFLVFSALQDKSTNFAPNTDMMCFYLCEFERSFLELHFSLTFTTSICNSLCLFI